MATVTGTGAPAGASVKAYLRHRVLGWKVIAATDLANQFGNYTLELDANQDNTDYVILIKTSYYTNRRTIVVPEGAGPFEAEDIETEAEIPNPPVPGLSTTGDVFSRKDEDDQAKLGLVGPDDEPGVSFQNDEVAIWRSGTGALKSNATMDIAGLFIDGEPADVSAVVATLASHVAADSDDNPHGLPAGVWDLADDLTDHIAEDSDVHGLPISAWQPGLINVRDHGAVGDGVTDDKAAINAALTAAATFGAKGIQIPYGTYIVSPALHSWAITALPNVGIYGPGTLKVPNSNPKYGSIIGHNGANDVSGFHVIGVTFDHNATNNVITAVVTDEYQMAIRVFTGSGFVVRDCVFKNIDSVNTVVFNGASLSRVTIENNDFIDVGGNSYHDHSTIYTQGTDVIIRGNRFFGKSGGLASTVTAIETHGARQVVSENIVTGYRIMANITGVASSSNNIVVSDNIGTGLAIGIMLWAMDYTGLVGPAFDMLSVCNNQIQIDFDYWAPAVTDYRCGIGLYPGSTGVATRVRIVGNTIDYLPYSESLTSASNQSAGILWYRASAGIVTQGTEDTDIDICLNRITGSLSAGVYFTPNIPAKRIRVNDNFIENPGNGTLNSAYRTGVFFATGTQGVQDVEVNRNFVMDTRGTHLVNCAVDTQFCDSGVTNARAVDNVLRCYDGSTVSVHLGDPSAAWFTRHVMLAYSAPTGVWTAGSSVLDTSTGITRVQTATPSGSTWTTAPVTITSLANGDVLTWGSDTNVYRGAANQLKTDDDFVAIGNISGANISASTSFTAPNFVCSSGMFFGDCNLYRGAANVLKTDDQFSAASFFLQNVAGTPSTPANGGILYAEAGALKYIGSSGTVTVIAPA